MKKITLIILIFLNFGYSHIFKDFVENLNNIEESNRENLIEKFMTKNDVKYFPIIEDTLAHFIYVDSAAKNVQIAGDFNGWNPENSEMSNIPGTHFFYLTESFEVDARLDYKIVVNKSNWIMDPKNPNKISGGFGSNSELAMSKYIQPDEIEFYENIPHGKIESFTFFSDTLNNSREVSVYLPPNYDEDMTGKYPTIYVNDGVDYINIAKMNNILDYLINKKEIQPIIGIFPNPVKRNEEYWINDQYAEMIVHELLVEIDRKYRTIDSPNSRAVMGASLGGLISVYISYNYPEKFGLCGSQSGSFLIDEYKIINQIKNNETKDIKFYLDWGTYETRIMNCNHMMVDMLRLKNYKISENEYHEGHSWGSWRAHIDDILKLFFSGK